ncbi:unnamed protein product [Clonostachys rosea f. rosea IK726]|uniref:Uncharacterized protein n=2 Tax=Bionectria ochroleuca TaxID=29856 RepID=A0A0B7KS60_BIOOC|nr:unnamed protein product [Clonostachys rosea f. rosea IK726]
MGYSHSSRDDSLLSAFSETLQQIRDCVSRLEGLLRNAAVTSERLRTHIADSLEECNGKTAALNKSLMRLQPDNLAQLNVPYFAAHSNLLTAYTRLFIYFGELLVMRTQRDQDAALDDSNVRTAIEKAGQTMRGLSSAGSILNDSSNLPEVFDREAASPSSPSSAIPSDLPPPYEPSSPSKANACGSWGGSAQAGPSSQPNQSTGWSFASIKESLVAMAAPFLPKPDPLVTALCEAAKRDDRKQMANHIDAVRILLSSGADEKNCSKMPALFLAASFGHLDIAKMLLASGNTKVKQESSSGQPYIVDVAATGNIEGTRFLLENGAKAKATTTSGRPMIVQSVKANDLEMTKLLLEHGAKVKSNDITGASLLSVAINKASPEMFEFLLARGASPDSKTTSGEYVLADVISKRNLKYARRLLDYKASANVKNIHGQKIIVDVAKDQQIAAGDKVELVRRLLERGASAKSKDMHWDLPVITHAMDKANGEVVSLLLRHGADIKTIMKGGETLLIHAVEGGLHDHMLALLEHDADTEATDQKGRTPLMLALLKTDLEAVRMLRRFEAEVTDAPRSFAESLGQPDMLEALGLKVPPPAPVPQPRATELPAHGGLGRPSSGHSYDVRDADLPSDPPPGYDTVDRLKN